MPTKLHNVDSHAFNVQREKLLTWANDLTTIKEFVLVSAVRRVCWTVYKIIIITVVVRRVARENLWGGGGGGQNCKFLNLKP